MNEDTNEERLLGIDVRPNTGIVRGPLDEVKTLRNLLADDYKDAGDGRTLFRELVQNADDAGARRLVLAVLERGWPAAQNSLLRGPALLVANDGVFPDKDREALHKAVGGSKEDDVGKIGMFGMGLKSVFHICEAFLYIGAENSKLLAGVLNPWTGTGGNRDADPIHPDWNRIDSDSERLGRVLTDLLGDASNGLLLWIPLRCTEHLDRDARDAPDRPYGLRERCYQPEDLCNWFRCSAPAALLLAQCGYLQAIDVVRAALPDRLCDRESLAHVTRKTAGWVERYQDDDGCFPDRAFEGEIVSEDRRWFVSGTEGRGSEPLRELRSHPKWPSSDKWENGRHSTFPRKALAHAAITVLRPLGAELSGTRLRWAVFLPLDDNPDPSSGAIVEREGPSPAWDIILHGYFWPSLDRRSIPGVTEKSENPGMRDDWNRMLCEELLLPLLPLALANAVDGVDERSARCLLDAVVRSKMLKERLALVRRRHWLLPLVTADGVRWKELDKSSSTVLSIPKWSKAPEVVRRSFTVSCCGECMDDVVFIDKDAPRIADKLDDWTKDHLERLLNCIQIDVFGSPQSLQWIKGCVRHVLGQNPCSGDNRAVAVVQWLVGRIGEGVLDHTTACSASRESCNELRKAWRELCDVLPKEWLVEVPPDTQYAVAELAAENVLGEGLFLVPFPRQRGESPPVPQIDQERLNRALDTLGKRLREGGEKKQLKKSRLRLAEILLSRRHGGSMDEKLFELPLLRTIKLPEEHEEGCSFAELHIRIEKHQVFTCPASKPLNSDGREGTQPERHSNPKQAVKELAQALGEPAWLVNREAVVSIDGNDVPAPSPDNLAKAVLHAKVFADSAHRKPLLRRLVQKNVSSDTVVRRAARVLLTGRAADDIGEDTELFRDRTGECRALPILLRLLDLSWRIVQWELVESLAQEDLDVLSVGIADDQALQRLLDDCLKKPVDWNVLSDEDAVQLLQDLMGKTLEDRQQWQKMPLHRGVDGNRGAFNLQARRSTGKTGELQLPPELQEDVRVLDPDTQVAHHYHFVPYMDRDGILRLMLEDSCPWHFAEHILLSIRTPEGSVDLPHDPQLLELLKDSCWLPGPDDDGIAPDSVLIAPKGLRDAVTDLSEVGAFGNKRLPDAIESEIWEKAESIVRKIQIQFQMSLSRKPILKLMLETSQPWHFAEHILLSIRTPEGSVDLPQDPQLLELLKVSCWLPGPDDDGIAPDSVLIAPKGLRDAVTDLSEVGAFGNKRLPDAIESEIWEKAESIVRKIQIQFQMSLSRKPILKLMLETSQPWHFAEHILLSIRTPEGSVDLPQDPQLLELLKVSCWLPGRDGNGIAPDSVLIAPKELLDAVADLLEVGVFGDRRLPVSVDSGIWGRVEPSIEEILGSPSQETQLHRMVESLDSERISKVDHGMWLVMPDPDLIDASLIENALQTPLSDSHPGWKMVHAADDIVGRGDNRSQDSHELIVRLAKVLCAPIPPKYQLKMLKNLAGSKPAKGSPDGRLYHKYLECFAKTEGFFTDVLPKLDLPTQDGNWHASQNVARTETGVARRHRLISELRPVLCEIFEDLIPQGTGFDTLEKYFDHWRDRVPHGAVGAFLSLLGKGLNNEIENLAQEWLGEDVAIESVPGLDRLDVSVLISPYVSEGSSVRAVNVLGKRVYMEADADNDTLFASDPTRRPRSQDSPVLEQPGEFWKITLRDVEPRSRSHSELMELLWGTVQRWAIRCLELSPEQVEAWWSRWGEGSQADFGPVLASIKAHLPQTLRFLDVKESEPLMKALKATERAQRKREQMSSSSGEKIIREERDTLDYLATLIDEPPHQEFLWERVNEKMRLFGYEPDSVLLELAQNADDALAEAAEIKDGPLPPSACRLLIRVHEHDGTPTVDVLHWGRPINDTGGASFPAGRERDWNQDLYFMMLMNMSGKPGEAPGESSSSSTTGRFGLGFKSVHLISSTPHGVSGFIAFTIAGGLLPQERAVPEETDSLMIEGHRHRSTRIRLPLRPDVETQTLLDRIFHRFSYARVLLPVFARQVREIVVEGGKFSGDHIFDGKPIDGAPGWSVGAECELPNHDGRWRILRFRPADAERKDMGTAALAVGIREGVPTAFGQDVPFLWNVAPTSENWGCGYIVNGPFKLDPGRTHVSLDDDTTLRAIRGLGKALGRGLIEIHDVLLDPADASLVTLVNRDGRSFLSSLWKVLASGMDNPDTLRRKLLLELHGNGRGISSWMAARSVVPSGLSAPFSPRLPPLDTGMEWTVASSGLDSSDLCAVLAEIDDDDFKSLVANCCVVSADVQLLLQPLFNPGDAEKECIRSRPLHPGDLFSRLAEQWEYRLTQTRLHALRPLSQAKVLDLIGSESQYATWRGKLRAKSADGIFQPLRNLLLENNPRNRTEVGRDLDEEFQISGFAPRNRILDPIYMESSEDWIVFRWLRKQHCVDAKEIVDWYRDLEEVLRPSAVRYLLYGELQLPVLKHLVLHSSRPPWLRNHDDVCRMLEDLTQEPWRRQRLLGTLFPNRPPEPEPSSMSHSDSKTIFQFQPLLEWWDNEANRDKVITKYEMNAWPEWLRRGGIANGLRTDSEDHWFALLVLGACRGLGRTHDIQHRNFLQWIYEKEWWNTFLSSDDADAWMKALRDWQDESSSELKKYSYWMSLFPSIYQISRYRDVYVDLLKLAEHPEKMYRVTCLLAPQDDEALTGTGTRFDAPSAPLDMGLHWVLRELVRLEVVEGKHLFPDCWVPSERVLRLLETLGLDRPDDGTSNQEKARAIHDFLVVKLGTEIPNLHLSFDIPLRHVDENKDLRHRFGWE